MSPARKIAAFLVGLVLAGGAGAALGSVVGPIDTGDPAPHTPTHEAPADTEPDAPSGVVPSTSAPSTSTTHGGDHGD